MGCGWGNSDGHPMQFLRPEARGARLAGIVDGVYADPQLAAAWL